MLKQVTRCFQTRDEKIGKITVPEIYYFSGMFHFHFFFPIGNSLSPFIFYQQLIEVTAWFLHWLHTLFTFHEKGTYFPLKQSSSLYIMVNFESYNFILWVIYSTLALW